MFRKEKGREGAAIVGTVEGVLDRKVQRPLSSLKEGILLVQKSPSDSSFFFLMTELRSVPPPSHDFIQSRCLTVVLQCWRLVHFLKGPGLVSSQFYKEKLLFHLMMSLQRKCLTEKMLLFKLEFKKTLVLFYFSILNSL